MWSAHPSKGSISTFSNSEKSKSENSRKSKKNKRAARWQPYVTKPLTKTVLQMNSVSSV